MAYLTLDSLLNWVEEYEIEKVREAAHDLH